MRMACASSLKGSGLGFGLGFSVLPFFCLIVWMSAPATIDRNATLLVVAHSFVFQDYILMAESCWSREVADRPTMENVLKALEELLRQVKAEGRGEE